MRTSQPIQDHEEFTNKTLAPVIPIKSVPRKAFKLERKISRVEEEKKMPLFYTKPIFKSKKHDLL